MNIETLKSKMIAAQRSNPRSPGTRDAQQAYASARNAELATAAATRRVKERAETARQVEAIRTRILAPRVVSKGAKLVLLTQQESEYLGMAPSAMGGWVAVALPRIRNSYVALLPSGWSNGLPIDLKAVQQAWASSCFELDELDDAAAKIEAL